MAGLFLARLFIFLTLFINFIKRRAMKRNYSFYRIQVKYEINGISIVSYLPYMKVNCKIYKARWGNNAYTQGIAVQEEFRSCYN